MNDAWQPIDYQIDRRVTDRRESEVSAFSASLFHVVMAIAAIVIVVILTHQYVTEAHAGSTHNERMLAACLNGQNIEVGEISVSCVTRLIDKEK